MSIQPVTELMQPDLFDKREAFRKKFTKPSLTIQSEKKKCCINNIMARYAKTGQIDHMRDIVPKYQDAAYVGTFQDAMNIVATAQQSFELMPAELRKKFDNDPATFISFVADPDNKTDLIKLGLVSPVVEAVSAPQNAGETASTTPPKEE